MFKAITLCVWKCFRTGVRSAVHLLSCGFSLDGLMSPTWQFVPVISSPGTVWVFIETVLQTRPFWIVATMNGRQDLMAASSRTLSTNRLTIRLVQKLQNTKWPMTKSILTLWQIWVLTRKVWHYSYSYKVIILVKYINKEERYIHHVHFVFLGRRLLMIAGIFDVWQPKVSIIILSNFLVRSGVIIIADLKSCFIVKQQGAECPLYSYSIITVDAHKDLSSIHNRMPVRNILVRHSLT